MVYTAPIDNFAYLEAYDNNELLYKKYYEVKNNNAELDALISSINNPRNYMFPEVYPDIEDLHKKTLFDDFYSHEITIRKHSRYNPPILHNHTFFEIIYVLSGTADNTIEGKLLKMSQSDICIIPPNVYHTMWVADESLIINIIVKKAIFNDTFFNELPKNNTLINTIKQFLYMHSFNNNKYLMFHALHNAPLRNIFALLISEGLNGMNNAYIKRSLLITIFNFIINNDLVDNYHTNHESDVSESIYSILRYIQDNYNTVSLQDVASKFNYSEPYLSKLIQTSTGISFINILQDAKLREACHLLATTDTEICDIPSLVGYESNVYFYRIFKKKIGTSPYKYRQMHKNTIIDF